MIQSKVADSIKAESALYIFKAACQVLPYVSEYNGNGYQFPTTILEPDRLAVALVAVDGRTRGRGIAQRMSRQAISVTESLSPERHVVDSVGTQPKNAAFIRSYTSPAFTLSPSRFITHTVRPKR